MEGRSQGTAFKVALLIGISAALFCSCRFKIPSQGEGQALAEAGSFPSGAPIWVKTPEGKDPARASNAGLIPRSYGAPQQVQSARALAPQARGSERERLDEEEDRQLREERRFGARVPQEEGDGDLVEMEEESPLDRINRVCPGTEDGVSDALGTVNATERIRKYEQLVRRCPSSADLWLWLGKDYQSAGRRQEARRAFERVLVIDRDNEAAKALLKVVENPSEEEPEQE